MAKFCSNCGAQMDDEDRVCGQCGTPFQGAAPTPTPAPAPAPTPSQAGGKSGGKGGFVGLVIGIIAAIVVIVIAVNVVGNFTGYKGTVNKMITALQKDDVATLESLASMISDAAMEDWYGDDYYDNYENMISSALDQFEDAVGPIKKIKYEITDVTEFSDRRMNDVEDDLVDRYNLDTDMIKKILKVQLKLTVKGSKKSSSYNVNNLYLVKESGGWKLCYNVLNY